MRLLFFAILACLSGCDLADEAIVTALPVFLDRLDAMEVRAWRLHLLILDSPGDSYVIQPFRQPAEHDQAWTLQCSSPCVVLFADLAPSAHFAHPTLTALYDGTSGELKGPQLAGWWPMVNGVPVFNTITRREATVVSVSDYIDLSGVPPFVDTTLDHPRLTLTSSREGPDPSVPRSPVPLAFQPRVKAVLIRGYLDVEDTFDEDVAGMNTILLATGVPPNDITTLDPEPCQTGATKLRDRIADSLTTIANGPIGSCSDLIVLFTSHGDSTGIVAGCDTSASAPLPPDWLDYTDFVPMLLPAASACDRTSVILEACYAGAFLAAASGTGLEARVFTSAASDQYSYGDSDIDDPLNPADSGSEAAWGLIEAWGTSSSDQDGDSRVSFNEAVDAAKTRDSLQIFRSIGSTIPATFSVSHLHGSWPLQTGGDLAVQFNDTSGSAASSADGGYVLRRCEPLELTVRVTNTGPPTSGPATLRVFANDEPPPDNWKPFSSDEHNLRTTVVVDDLHTGGWVEHDMRLLVPKHLCLDDSTRLVATVDSIGEPLPAPSDTLASNLSASNNTAEIIVPAAYGFWDRLCCFCRSLCFCP